MHTTWIPKFRREIPSGTLAGANSHSKEPFCALTRRKSSLGRNVPVSRGGAAGSVTLTGGGRSTDLTSDSRLCK